MNPDDPTPKSGINLTAFMEGMDAYDEDAETGKLTDCPYQTPIAMQEWWKGYHYKDAETKKP